VNYELIHFGFITIRIVDVVDILLVSLVLYYLWKLSRNTRAARMWVGILLLLAFGMIARVLNLRALSWILASLSAFWAVAFVILFQPELRRALSDVGQSPLSRHRLSPRLSDNIGRACSELTSRKWGALILLRRKIALSPYIETGNSIQSELSSELLVTIFTPGSPLHDGAVIIDNDTIIAARCVLPVADEAGESIGMRHRAALGASQETDAVALAVSEETGKVSIAVDGSWLLFRGEATEVSTILSRHFT
jgi:diadenylate cyclase